MVGVPDHDTGTLVPKTRMLPLHHTPNFGGHPRYRAGLSGFSDRRFHLISLVTEIGGDGGSRTLNYRLQAGRVPASTTPPLGWSAGLEPA